MVSFYLLIILALWRANANLVQNVSPPLRHAGLQAGENREDLLTDLGANQSKLNSVVFSIFCRFCPIPVMLQLVWPTLSHVCLDLWPSELDNWNDGEPQSVLIQLRDKNYPTGAALEGFILNSQGLLWIVDKPFWTRATTIRPRTLTSHLTTNRDRSQYFTSSLRSTSSFRTFLQLPCF